MPTIERLHAPDYELISPPGRVMSRERYLSLLAADVFYAGLVVVGGLMAGVLFRRWVGFS